MYAIYVAPYIADIFAKYDFEYFIPFIIQCLMRTTSHAISFINYFNQFEKKDLNYLEIFVQHCYHTQNMRFISIRINIMIKEIEPLEVQGVSSKFIVINTVMQIKLKLWNEPRFILQVL